MSQGYDQNPYAAPSYDRFVIDAPVSERATFIRRTYAHLFGAIAAFIAIEAVIFSSGDLAFKMAVAVGSNWWMVIIAFMVVSVVAQRMASSSTSLATQYAGLGLFVAIESVIFVPLLYMAATMGAAEGEAFLYIKQAGLITGVLFTILTAIVMFTKADFSFMGRFLMFAGFGAIALIFMSMIFGFPLGVWFIGAMVMLMCGYILYDTSNIMRHYRTDQHVSASLALFASVATLFYYVLMLVMSRD